MAIIGIWWQLSSTLKARQYQSYIEHRRRIFAQGFGMFMFCNLNLASEIMFVNRMMNLTVQKYFDSSLDETINYILFLGPQLCACLIYVLFKIPEDCFHCFNRIPHIAYSQFQFPLVKRHYHPTPQPELPNQTESCGTPTSSIAAMMGFDMQFLMEHFAGDEPTDSHSDTQQNSQLSFKDYQTTLSREA